MDLKQIINAIDFIVEARDYVSENKDKILKMALKGEISIPDFYRATSTLSSQSRSPYWEKFMIKYLKARKLKASENIGDFEWMGKNYEYKISGVNKGFLLHAVQLRLWQRANYMIHYVDRNYESWVFILSHEQMQKECELLKATAAHGTKEANDKNENIELRFTIDPNSKDMDRWKKNYTIKIF